MQEAIRKDADARIVKLEGENLRLSNDLAGKVAEIASAREAAAKAQATAEGFRLDIAKANQRAEEAKERAAQANLELARFKAPRTLSPEQQKQISEKLKTFAGRQFDVAILVEPEPQDLLLQVENALTAAGWIEIDWKGGGNFAEITFVRKGRPTVGIATVSGLIVQMHPDQVSELGTAAQALTSALNAEGISAKAEPGLGIDNINTKAIHILIGKKAQ